MTLGLFGFLNISFTDVLDILLVAVFIYLAFRWIKSSSMVNIVAAIATIYFLSLIMEALDMKMMSSLFNTVLDMGVLAMIIIFQPEIRRFLLKFGSGGGIGGIHRFAARFLGIQQQGIDGSVVNEITEACRRMSESKTGALIVLPHRISLESIIESGDRIDALVHRRLIMNLFFKNSPLHDGAMIISGDRIVAARCTLPITQKTDIPPSYGMRHKAAIGISEESDADVIVVSEETGTISFIREGNISEINNLNELKLMLGNAFSGSAHER